MASITDETNESLIGSTQACYMRWKKSQSITIATMRDSSHPGAYGTYGPKSKPVVLRKLTVPIFVSTDTNGAVKISDSFQGFHRHLPSHNHHTSSSTTLTKPASPP